MRGGPPIPGKSGVGPPSPIPGKSGMGTGMGIGGSVPWLVVPCRGANAALAELQVPGRGGPAAGSAPSPARGNFEGGWQLEWRHGAGGRPREARRPSPWSPGAARIIRRAAFRILPSAPPPGYPGRVTPPAPGGLSVLVRPARVPVTVAYWKLLLCNWGRGRSLSGSLRILHLQRRRVLRIPHSCSINPQLEHCRRGKGGTLRHNSDTGRRS